MSQPEHTRFLPAAIEIERTPPRPLGRAVLWSIILVFVSAITWASVGKVDIVAVAVGRVIPTGHSKPIQVQELGTVAAIHVQDGQQVKPGDLLISLDDSSAQADLKAVSDALVTAQAEEARLKTLLGWCDKRPADKQLETADSIAHARWAEYLARLDVHHQERARISSERESAQREQTKYAAILPLITERASNQRRLARKKMLAQDQYLQIEQTRLQVMHDLKTQTGKVAELDMALKETHAKERHTVSDFKRQLTDQAEEARKRIDALRQERAKAEHKLRIQRITAPVAGRVQQLIVHHQGAVVTPAQVLMTIVPEGGPIEIEANLENREIGFVHEGQEVEVKVEAFRFTKYGTLSGRITQISKDAVVTQEGVSTYALRVRLEKDGLRVGERWARLSPGMQVSVEAKTGKRRLIEYFWSPIQKKWTDSVRER